MTSLPVHMKVTTDLASLRSKVVALHKKAEGWLSHAELDTALAQLALAESAMGKAMTALGRLPADYMAHASRIKTTDLTPGAVVSIREAKRPSYADIIPAEYMEKLTVVAMGKPFVTIDLPNGLRIAVTRGDIATV